MNVQFFRFSFQESIGQSGEYAKSNKINLPLNQVIFHKILRRTTQQINALRRIKLTENP